MSMASTFVSFDVLSKGAEFSGNTANLFLSVWRKPLRHCDEPPEDRLIASTLLGRYLIAGCAGDTLSRAAADQKYSLSLVKAVFCTTSSVSELSCLPGLLYALQRAGACSLSIVSMSAASHVQDLVELVHGNRPYPSVNICQAPRDESGWWKVYSDDHICVHASSLIGREQTNGPSILYLITLNALVGKSGRNSILYIPETLQDQALDEVQASFSDAADHRFDLPVLPSKGCQAALLGTVAIRPESSSLAMPDDWFVFASATSCVCDEQLLVRSRSSTRSLRKQVEDTDVRNVFPMCQSGTENSTPKQSELQTGSSIVLDPTVSGSLKCYVLDRRPCPLGPPVEHQSLDPNSKEEVELRQHPVTVSVNDVRKFCDVESLVQTNKDENEIDLDDEHDDEDHQQAKLLVMGTGCASPSPLRGASAYALVLPSNAEHEKSVLVLEAGEGFCTQWNRHASGIPLRCVKVIWISHAHWDHYGGIVNLLLRIEQSRKELRKQPKRQRTESSPPPFVVAPRRVIRYLSAILKDRTNDLFSTVHPTDAAAMDAVCSKVNNQSGDTSLVSWDIVKVNHGCEAYGLALGLKRRSSCGSEASFLFAFSGDTRPSPEFIRCANTAARNMRLNHVDLLVHESTFSDDEIAMSIAKKHSTVNEAVDVARRVKARRLLLTHFSQRYNVSCKVPEARDMDTNPVLALCAVDGMEIPLF